MIRIMTSSSMRNPRSLVNNYEVTLLETRSSKRLEKTPNSEEVQKCFQIFDEVIPLLGQYKRVIQLIRDHVYDAVYSTEYTVGVVREECSTPSTNSFEYGSETALAKTATIERVPHFVILNKILSERNKRADEAEAESGRLKVVLGQVDEKVRELVEHNEGLEEAIERQKEEIQELVDELENNKEENKRLDEKMKAQHEEMSRKTERFEEIIENLNEKNSQQCTKVTELKRFKSCHDDIQDHFRDPSAFSSSPQKGLFSAKEQKLRKDINEGKAIEKQLLFLRNTCIEEFDELLEKQVSLEKDIVTSLKNRTNTNNDLSLEMLKTEEKRKNENSFVNMIASIDSELEQNMQHLLILKADLDKLNEIKRESYPKAKSKVFYKLEHGMDQHDQSEENEARLLEMVKDSSKNYQFLPQEPILNKYAITVSYSCNQGETFHELQNVQHCRSCAQKTLVCPHKVTKGDSIFHLPLQCTHIKFSRPLLHVPASSVATQDISEEKVAILSSMPAHLEHCKNYVRLWNDLAAREVPSTQLTQRFIEDDFLISLIKQFYDSVIWRDFSDDKEEIIAMLEAWYVFLNDRYQIQSVAFSVAKNVLDAIARTVQSNRFVQLFVECLCGNLDPAVFRYYLTLSEFIKSIKWSSKADFACFVKIVYPFMSNEDLEQFTMSYTSFSENKISATLICRFILYIILKQREPSFLEMESKLVNYQQEPNVGFMTDAVFFEVMAEMSPLSSEPLCHRLVAQSKADIQADNRVSISRLSQISSFLDLHQRTAVIEMEINEKLQIDEDYCLYT